MEDVDGALPMMTLLGPSALIVIDAVSVLTCQPAVSAMRRTLPTPTAVRQRMALLDVHLVASSPELLSRESAL